MEWFSNGVGVKGGLVLVTHSGDDALGAKTQHTRGTPGCDYDVLPAN